MTENVKCDTVCPETVRIEALKMAFQVKGNFKLEDYIEAAKKFESYITNQKRKGRPAKNAFT